MKQADHFFAGLRFLHSPGPTHVPKAVMDALTGQPLDMADERLDPLIHDCEQGLRRLVGSDQGEVMLYASNGHGVWEAVTVNLVAPGQKILVASTGHFSDSWAKMSQAMGALVVHTPYVEGEPIDPLEVERLLAADSDQTIVAVYVVQTDTASGVTSDVAAIRAAMDRTGHSALLVVDVVASLAAETFEMDAWGVNVALGASQKGLMCPPGLAFCVVDDKAIARAQANPMPRYYWDWNRRRGAPSYRKFCGTPPQNLLMALRAAIGLIEQEGLAQVQARHRRLAAAVHAAVTQWGTSGQLGFVCRSALARAVGVTSIAVSSADPEAIRQVAREQFNVAIAGGLGSFQGRVFRIGHLGDLSAPMVLGCLAGVQGALQASGVAIGQGGLEAALAALGQDASLSVRN